MGRCCFLSQVVTLKNRFDREFSVFGGELREVRVCGEASDEFRTGHTEILPGLPVSDYTRPAV
jgi:hypothetical protein